MCEKNLKQKYEKKLSKITKWIWRLYLSNNSLQLSRLQIAVEIAWRKIQMKYAKLQEVCADANNFKDC